MESGEESWDEITRCAVAFEIQVVFASEKPYCWYCRRVSTALRVVFLDMKWCECRWSLALIRIHRCAEIMIFLLSISLP